MMEEVGEKETLNGKFWAEAVSEKVGSEGPETSRVVPSLEFPSSQPSSLQKGHKAPRLQGLQRALLH